MTVCHANAGEQRCEDEERETHYVGAGEDLDE